MTQPGEKERIQDVSNQFQRMQMMNFNEHHHCLRGTHLKTQGVRPVPPLPFLPLTSRPRPSASSANSSSTKTCPRTSPKACSRSRARTT